jgi:hypothetical protein
MIFLEHFGKILVQKVIDSEFASQRVSQIGHIRNSYLMVPYKTYNVLLGIEFEPKTRSVTKKSQIWQRVITHCVFNENKTLVVFLLYRIKLDWPYIDIIIILVKDSQCIKVSYPPTVCAKSCKSILWLQKVILDLNELFWAKLVLLHMILLRNMCLWIFTRGLGLLFRGFTVVS